MNRETIHEAVGQFIRLDRRHRALIERQVGEMGLHRSQHRMLLYLSRQKQTPSQAELARFLEISPPAVATALKRLEVEGYIRRSCSKQDSRNNIITVTDKGRAVLEDTRCRFDEVDGAMFAGFEEDEVEAFCDFIRRLEQNLKNYETRCGHEKMV